MLIFDFLSSLGASYVRHLANFDETVRILLIDDESFKRYYKKYYRSVMTFFISRGFSRQEGEDLAQEVFLRVYKYRRQFRGEASFRTYVQRISENIWKNQIRSEQTDKRKGVEVPWEEPDKEEGNQRREPSAFEELEGKEMVLRLQAIIEGFPQQMRHCAVLRFHHRLKYREIATVLQISIESVKTQLNLAKQRINHELSNPTE